jgi:hypothetical protein
MSLVSFLHLTKSTHQAKFLHGAVHQKPPRTEKHLYSPQYQRDGDLVDAAPGKTQNFKVQAETDIQSSQDGIPNHSPRRSQAKERLGHTGKEKGRRIDVIHGSQLARGNNIYNMLGTHYPTVCINYYNKRNSFNFQYNYPSVFYSTRKSCPCFFQIHQCIFSFLCFHVSSVLEYARRMFCNC